MTNADPDGRKLHIAGTHRVVEPASTLARILPLAARMGITRVAVLTGLDRVGIPVAAAVRPNSRSIAVHQGKGLSLDAAKASAVMEAVECYHAETADLPLRRRSFAEITADAEAADPALLPRCRGRAYAGERLLWVEGRDLLSGRPFWLPHELVSIDFAERESGAGLFQAGTNGLAAGNHWLEAMLHALCETIERDALALWRAQPEPAGDRTALDPRALEGTAARPLLVAFAQAGVAIRVWDITSDIGIPSFVCLAVALGADEADEPELGSGCHLDRDVALARALTEAAQARLTRISGARDDFEPASYGPRVRAARQKAARRWLAGRATTGFTARAGLAGVTLRHDLDVVLRRLSDAGMRHVGYVDLTQPELGIPVARVVVPGLEGPWTPPDGDYTPGTRARVVA
ncbi:MAG: YcaO-like family protein [Rhodospirillales bacterium]|nr:YcaO-like family protein [Rhodospirillales bacterium]